MNVRTSHILTGVLFATFLWTGQYPAGIRPVLASPGMTGETETVTALTAERRAAIIDSVLTTLVDHYVLPDVALEMDRRLRSHLARGQYASSDDLGRFTNRLTDDLHAVNEDRHLRITPLSGSGTVPAADRLTAAELDLERRQNHGFVRVERLMGNVGYLELQMFADPADAGGTAAAAMAFIAHCDAVIIDLRTNGGGDEGMVQLLASYFMREPTKLRSFRHRGVKEEEQSWTLPYVPGKVMDQVAVYILTNRHTASAAEAFTSAMKHLRGAVVVGERTRGAAYTVDFFLFPTLGVRAKVSTGCPVEATTGGNWEGGGIEPDIEVTGREALEAAHHAAVEALARTAADDLARFEIDWVMQGYHAARNPVQIEAGRLRLLAGKYENLEIRHEAGALRYLRENRSPSRLLPMTATLFRFEDDDSVRIRFTLDADGRATKLEILYDDFFMFTRQRTGD